MPLRSVEAASREDAIAAAREQFGPRVRIIGVRRVRSGGVLGFFATERYVAEVEPDVRIRSTAQPAAERADAGRKGSIAERAAELAAFLQAADEPALPHTDHRVDEIAELLSGDVAEPPAATYSRSAMARPTPVEQPVPAPSFADALAAAAPSSGRTSWFSSPSVAEQPASSPAPSPASAPAADPFHRASFPRTSRKAAPAELTPSAILREQPAATAPAPSPFTAALARMVAGDGVVRQAVQDALDEQLARETGRGAGPWDADPEPVGANETSTGAKSTGAGHHSSGAEHQEEKPVSEMETTSGASPSGQPHPTWGAPSTAIASREEAIAQVLRTALAQNHSDEALADILRKVLADGSTEPAAPATTAAAPVPMPMPVPEPVPAPVPTQPVEASVWAAPAAAEPLWAPAAATEAVWTQPAVEEQSPMSEQSTTTGAEAAMTELPSVEDGAPAEARLADVTADEPIWAEVVLHEPVPAEPVPAERVPAAPAPTVASLADAIRAQIIGDAAAAPAVPPAAVAVAAEPVVEPVTAVAEESATAEVAAPPAATATVEEDAAPADEAIETEQHAEPVATEQVAAQVAELAMPQLARTASDPAPLPADATTIMPPLSLLPPLPNRRAGGRPPVPPPSRPAAAAAEEETTPRGVESLATVTRLHLAPPVEAEQPETEQLEADPIDLEPAEPDEPPSLDLEPEEADWLELDAAPATSETPSLSDELTDFMAEIAGPMAAPEPALLTEPAVPVATASIPVRQYDAWTPLREPLAVEPPREPDVAPASPLLSEEDAEGIVGRLHALGIPRHLLGGNFSTQAETKGTYAALTAALAARLPEAPVVPTGAGEVLFVIGPGVATLRAGRSIAASLGLHPDCVQWASRGELAGLAPQKCRMSTIDAAIDRRSEAAGAGTVTIVAVDAPLRTDAYWMAQMLAVWTPVAVWAVVEATRKPEDLGPWLQSLPRVDALILQDTDLSVDPAAVLERVSAPVALLDGVRATPHRWASLLCERLETDPT